ncbi:MAG: helix-turn-helix transcriptional regulator [Victivallales bacterium]
MIDEDFSDPELNIERIAELLHVNRVSLSRSFSRLYGTSISGYLSGHRISCLEYLKNTELSIAEIAGMCGFSSASYFSRVISEATGRPPGKIHF